MLKHWPIVVFFIMFFALLFSCMQNESMRIELREDVKALKKGAKTYKQWAEEFSYRLRTHTESIHYGRVIK